MDKTVNKMGLQMSLQHRDIWAFSCQIWDRRGLLLPADVCLNFSLFFFLHFQGLNRRPKLANLLLRRMGGVWVPGTSESERIAAKRSTSSAGRRQKGEFTALHVQQAL